MGKGFNWFTNNFLASQKKETIGAVSFGHALAAISFPSILCEGKASKTDRICTCPKCGSEAVYKYGKAWTGKQRFLCLICGFQFTDHPDRAVVSQRPKCPECGRLMHLYKKEKGFVRFRCSSYPGCKTFIKINIEGEEKLK